MPRFHCKHGKDGTGSVSIPRISGFHGRYYQDGTEPSSSENKKDSGGVPTDRGRACNRPHPQQIDWQNECHKPGDPTSSSVLQEPTNGPENGSKESRPGLRDTSQSIPRQLGGTDLVGHPNDKMEWQDSISNGARPDHRIRRFIPRLGSVLPRHQHRATLVSSGEVAHQLPRTASSDSSTKNLCEEHEGTITTVEDRQHNSSCLHQQPRGNYIQGFDSSRDLWMWCLERNIHIQAQYLPRVLNQVADMESRSMKDRSDWKLDRSVFLKINKRYGSMEVELFATRLTNQCRRYFSWRPDPFAEATDTFLQD